LLATSGRFSASISGDTSNSRTKETTYSNSTLNANNINLNTSKDTNIKGANIHGSDSLTYNVGGDLNLASVQDTHKSSNHSKGANV